MRDHALEINPDWDVVQEDTFSLQDWLHDNPPGTYHHYHSADEIQYGILPVEHGGLGAGNVADALRGIGISPTGHTHDAHEITGVTAALPIKLAAGTGVATTSGSTIDFDDADLKINYTTNSPFISGKVWIIVSGGSMVHKIYLGNVGTTSFRAYSGDSETFSYLAIGATA